MASLSNTSATKQDLWVVCSKSLMPNDTPHIFEYFSSSEAARTAADLITVRAFFLCRHAFIVNSCLVEDVLVARSNNRQIIVNDCVQYTLQTTVDLGRCNLHAQAMRIREEALEELQKAQKILADFKY